MKYIYKLHKLNCPNCANKIETKLNEHKDIEKAIVNFNKQTVSISTNKEIDIMNIVKETIRSVEPSISVVNLNDNTKNNYNYKIDLIRLITGLAIGLISIFLLKGILAKILIIIAYLILLSKTGIKALKMLKNKNIDENLLVTISCIGAYLTNNIHEGLMVILLYDIGKILEEVAVNNSRKSIKELMKIKPISANLLKNNKLIEVSPEEVKIGDIIVIKPGNQIPLDGLIIKGTTKLNTQSLTGESKLLPVTIGDKVLSGMINTSSIIHLKVTNNYQSSTVSKILSLIDEATDRKAKTENFVKKAAKIYTPTVLILAILSAILLPIITKIKVEEAIYRALVFLVISCPCAIAISVPLSYFSGIGVSSKRGILIKGSDYLDNIGNIKEIIFDKTGTLTTGVFSDYTIEILNKKYQKEDIIKYYVSLETMSNHPIAKSIVRIFKNDSQLFEVEEFKEIPGMGISGYINNQKILIGNALFCQANSSDEQIYLNIDGKNIAKLSLKDGLRKEAKETISELKKLGIKIKMYTGDNQEIADEIAKKLAIDEYKCHLLPQDKYNLLKEELKDNKKIAFIGDGINDAPALTLSPLGISLGGISSDAAIESSDIVIMDDNLLKIIECIKISRYTTKIIKQNLIFSLSIKLLVLILSFFGLASMYQAVFADTGVTLLAIINTTRILKYKNIDTYK